MRRKFLVIVVALAWLATSAGGAGATMQVARNTRGDRGVLWEPYRPVDVSIAPDGSAVASGFGPFMASAASPAAAFQPFAQLAPAGIDSFDVQVDDAGGAVATWIPLLGTADNPYHGVPMVALRAPGGAFGAPVPLPSGGPVNDLKLAVNAPGEAIALWQRPDGTYQDAVRPPGGTFGAAESVNVPPAAVKPLLLTLDDNGEALGAWESGGGGPRVFYATRPPGGSFGTAASVMFPDPVIITAGGDRSGDGLLVGEAGQHFEVSERRAGGPFSAPAVAFSEPVGESVKHVATTSAGDAAIVFEGERVEVTVRSAGGSFGPLTTIVPPGPNQESPQSDLAADSRGDFAIGWRAPDNAVRFSYRPAGGSFGRPIDLAPAQAYSADTAIPPALALDDSGQGTAAWEHSDGERLTALTSSFDAQHASQPQAIGSISAYQRFNRPGACTPRRAHLLLRTRVATMFRLQHETYGCSRSRGQPVPLDGTGDHFGETAAGPPAAALAGPFVGNATEYEDPISDLTLIGVTDLRDPTDGFNRSASAYRGKANSLDGSIAAVPAVRLRPNGAIAWVACRNPYDRKRVRLACARPGAVAKRLFKWNTDGRPPRLLDAGREIDPRTVRLHGSTLTWVDAGRRHSARLD